MVRNYFILLIRNTLHHKGFALINLLGLVIGMTVCLQVYVFVNYEKGFDQVHSKNIYRICEIKQEHGDDAPKKIAQTVFPLAPALKAEFPLIKNFARVISGDKTPLQSAGKPAVMGTMFGVESSFLTIFDFNLLKGNAVTALREPRSIVLSKRLSRALFGHEDPLGKMVRNEARDTTEYIVTGLMQDVPAQSHLQFDALYSLSTYEGLDTTNDWDMDWLFTYIELNDGADINSLENNFPDFINRHKGKTNTISFSLFLQPLKDVHLRSVDITRDQLNLGKFNGNYLPPLIAVAVFVMMLAVINYINLSTARLFTRAKEVAVRKTSGASRIQISFQFLLETIIFSVVALILSICLMLLLLPLFSQLSQRELDFNLLRQPLLLLLLLVIAFVTGILSGILPAISLAGLQPVKALKGHVLTGSFSSLRSMLVVIQFTISIALSMITLNVFRQLQFVQHYNTGFDKDAVIVLPVSYTDRQKEETMMYELKQVPGVYNVTGALRRLGSTMDRNRIIFESDKGSRELVCTNMFIDFNYCTFYKIDFLAGRNLSEAYGSDRKRQSYIINESLAHELTGLTSDSNRDISNLIGRRVRYAFDDEFGTIVGIVRDFNFSSLHQRIEPMCMTYLDEYYFTDISVRLNLRETKTSLAQIEKVWKKFLPNQQFSYQFLDKQLEKLYSSDIQTSRYIALFALLAFVVGCLGIIGMAAFHIERRVKEIGIRKVLGASVIDIIVLLSQKIIKLVFLSIVVACPVALLVVNRWLLGFAYRVDLSWIVFAATGLAALLIAQLTISFQAIRAAIMNPIKNLRSE